MPCEFFQKIWGNAWNEVLAIFKSVKSEEDKSDLLKVLQDRFNYCFKILKKNRGSLAAIDPALTSEMLDNLTPNIKSLIIDALFSSMNKDSDYQELLDEDLEKLDRILRTFDAHLKAICAQLTGKSFVLLRSSIWPTAGYDDKGYKTEFSNDLVPETVIRAIECVQVFARSNSALEGWFPLDKPFKRYPKADLFVLPKGESRLVLKAGRFDGKVRIYFCFWATVGMHNADFGTDQCVNIYSRIYKDSCKILRFEEFGPWKEVEDIGEFSP